MNLKHFKIVKKLKNFSPKLKWLIFSQVQDLKIGARYIDYLIPDETKTPEYDGNKLEMMVRDALIKEFSPKVRDLASYELLVDSVVHNLKKKQLAQMGSQDDLDLDDLDLE